MRLEDLGAGFSAALSLVSRKGEIDEARRMREGLATIHQALKKKTDGIIFRQTICCLLSQMTQNGVDPFNVRLVVSFLVEVERQLKGHYSYPRLAPWYPRSSLLPTQLLD